MPEDNRIYSAPSLPSIVAYLSAAVVIFFAGYNLYLEHELANLRRDVQRLREEMEQAQSAAALAAAENISAAAPTFAPLPRREAERMTAAEKTPPVAPPPRAITPLRPPVEARAIEVPASGDIALARAPGPDTEAMLQGQATPAEAQPLATPTVSRSGAEQGRGEQPPPQPAALEKSQPRDMAVSAQILATNPEQMRVIVSIGANQGIAPGRRFNVYRGNAWVGDVRVVKTFADMSMCEIITPTSRGMRVGDIAKAAPEKEEGA